MSEPRPKSSSSPLRWILFAVVLVVCVYAVWSSGGVTGAIGGGQSHPAGLGRLGSGPACQLPPELNVAGPIDLRLSEHRTDDVRVSRRFTVGVSDGSFRLPTPDSSGEALVMGSSLWRFDYTPTGCSNFRPASLNDEPAEPAAAPPAEAP